MRLYAGSKIRLENARRQAALAIAARQEWHTGPLPTWRDYRVRLDLPLPHPPTRNDRKIFADDTDIIGKYLGDNDELCKEFGLGSRRGTLGTSGYYTDAYGDGSTMIPGVTFLRSSKGGLYIPTTRGSDFDGITLHMSDAVLLPRGRGNEQEDAISEALHEAHHHAEKEADHMREEDIKYHAEQRIASAFEELSDLRETTVSLVRTLRTVRDYYSRWDQNQSGLCTRLEDQIDEKLEERRDLFKEIRNLEERPWTVAY